MLGHQAGLDASQLLEVDHGIGGVGRGLRVNHFDVATVGVYHDAVMQLLKVCLCVKSVHFYANAG